MKHSGKASLTAGDIDNGSSDNCSIVLKDISKSIFTCSDIGTNDVVLTITDEAGNLSMCTAQVQVDYSTAPSPSAFAIDDTICTGQVSGIRLDNSFENISYTWTVALGPDIAGATGGSYDASSTGLPRDFAQTLTNNGDSVEQVIYTVTPTIYGECSLSSIPATILVNPQPRIEITG